AVRGLLHHQPGGGCRLILSWLAGIDSSRLAADTKHNHREDESHGGGSTKNDRQEARSYERSAQTDQESTWPEPRHARSITLGRGPSDLVAYAASGSGEGPRRFAPR